MRSVAVFVCALAGTVLGCASRPTSLADTSGRDAGSDDGAIDGSAADAGDAGPGAEGGATGIDVPASHGSWSADRDVTLTGAGSGDLGAIALAHGVGSLTFGGTEASAFYFVGTAVPLGDAGADSGLAQERDLELVAAQPGRLLLVWITCYDADLAYVYYETTDGLASTASMPASGVCDVVDQPLSESAALPAVALPPPELVGGFTIAGAELSYDGTGPGTATFAGETWAAYPFHTIDCTSCAADGWYELHTLFWDPSKRDACLGILYLFPSAPAEVELAYLVCLPGVTSPLPGDQQVFASSWHPAGG